MHIVRQTKSYDCGVAVAAMVGNVSYAAVLDRLITGLSSETTLNELVMWRTLQDITRMEWQFVEVPPPRPRLRDWSFPETPIAVLIERADSSRHYVAVLGRFIYDPLFEEPIATQEYADGNSSVITVFAAKTPAAEPGA